MLDRPAASSASSYLGACQPFRGVSDLVFKICTRAEWQGAERAGVFPGTPIDRRDGFIHFSAGDQVAETAAKHFAGERDLVLVAVEAKALGAALKWEVSRGGALFPHLYGMLPLGAVAWVKTMPADAAGHLILPDLGPLLHGHDPRRE